jgi:nucleoside-diphosphate-sugar epimerase
VDLIATCLHHPAAANQTFLVSDGEDLTVTALLQRTASAFGRPAFLLPVPMFLLRMGGRVLGKEAVVQRFAKRFRSTSARPGACWAGQPPVSVDAAR